MERNQKNIFWLGLVSFINDTSSKIILPILPLFIKSIGGTGLAVGLISGLGESIASLLKMIVGFLSDKLGKRKPFVFLGYLTASISKILFAFSNTWPQVLVLYIGKSLGKGLRSAPRDALLADSTEKKRRGRGFGIHRAMDSGGGVLGSIIVLVLFWNFGFSFRSIFLVAGILAFLCLIPLSFVKETYRGKREIDFKVGLKGLPKPLKFFIFVATIFALGNFSYMFFILKSQDYFAGKLAVGIPIILYLLYEFSYTIFAVPAGILSDKIGRKNVLFAGYFLFGLVCLGFIFSKSLLFFIILFILFGLNYALVDANQRAFVADLAQKDNRGTALGTFHMFTSLAALPAGLIAGFIWDINPTYPFIYGISITLFSLILFFYFFNFKKFAIIITRK